MPGSRTGRTPFESVKSSRFMVLRGPKGFGNQRKKRELLHSYPKSFVLFDNTDHIRKSLWDYTNVFQNECSISGLRRVWNTSSLNASEIPKGVWREVLWAESPRKLWSLLRNWVYPPKRALTWRR